MKGLILSGGAGTRLRPITHTSAKQLVPIANKPILFYGIEDMVAAGIREIGIIVGDTAPEIVAAVGDGSRFGAEVTYIRQDEPLGLAHCVLIARSFLGDEDFVMYLGDNMLQQGLAEFVDEFESARTRDRDDVPAAQILLAHVDEPSQFGVAVVDGDGHVTRLVEKPKDPPSDLALVGVYLFDASDPRGGRVDRAVGAWRARDHRCDPVAHRERSAGAPRGAARLVDRHRQEGPAARVQPSRARDARVLQRRQGRRRVDHRGPGRARERCRDRQLTRPRPRGHRGADTRVENSYVGPFTSIAADCEIVDSELDHSVVLEGSRIAGIARLTDSLVGHQVEVVHSDARPRALRLMLGDHSKVELD